MIREFEEENLRPRSWDLQGEVTNDERQKDELLRKHIEVDFRAKNGFNCYLSFIVINEAF